MRGRRRGSESEGTKGARLANRFSRREACLILAGLMSGAGLAELAYRLSLEAALHRDLAFPVATYRVASRAYCEYDRQHGGRLPASRELWISFVQGGRLVWGTTASVANADGLGGRTTFAQYRAAKTKVLVLGDSFTHWNQGGDSWPDLLQAELARRGHDSLAVLNLARGTYGVLQMLDLAADAVESERPDLVLLAAIGDDFSRARWWCQSVPEDGVERWLLSPSPDGPWNDRGAVDEVLVASGADRAWCERVLAHGGSDDELLGLLNALFERRQRQFLLARRNPALLSFSTSYLANRLLRGDPYGEGVHVIPRVSFEDFGADRDALRAIHRLAQSNVPIRPFYLPLWRELRAGQLQLSRSHRRLKESLERLLGAEFLTVGDGCASPVPGPFDLSPYDLHPSRAGLEYYAGCIASEVEVSLTDNRMPRNAGTSVQGDRRAPNSH